MINSFKYFISFLGLLLALNIGLAACGLYSLWVLWGSCLLTLVGIIWVHLDMDDEVDPEFSRFITQEQDV